MVGLNCRSSSSSFPSSPLHSAPSALDNGLLQNILNLTPRLSSHNNPEGPVAVMTTVPFLCSLETTFPDQASLCWDLEKTVNCRSIISNGTQAPKSSAELRKEIARIEVEILHLEHYLLSLYRTAFKGHVSTLSNNTSTELQDKAGLSSLHVANQSHYRLEPHVPRDGFVHHDKTSPAHNWEISDIQSCTASLKATSTRDHRNSDSGHCSLADILGASHIDRSLHTPDRLSEDIVKCICSIYCKLANGPNNHAGLAVSPTSSNSLSSSSIFSSKNPCDSWSPHCNENAAAHHELKRLKEGTGSQTAMVEVRKICLDGGSFNYAAAMVQKFRSLVRNLEKVDPNNMKREEKLAFWINIHNALVMHAYLAYGTRNQVKSAFILKAAYNVGGHCVNAYFIQSSILGIRPHHSAPWLRTLFSHGRKLKAGSPRHVYALEYPEPLVHFALSSGAYSDPVVKVYTAKSIFKDLKLAKEEFIQASVYIHKETKIFLPKILQYFAKDMSLGVPGLLEDISGCLLKVQQKAIRKCMKGRYDRYVHWLPQSATFRYIIHGELAEGRTSDNVLTLDE